jgi:uncharacterized protein (TIGR02147 family)
MNYGLDIYKFDRLKPLLEQISVTQKDLSPRRSSLTKLAQRLGYKSPRSLGMVFGGKRLPSAMMIHRLSSMLKLNFEQREYFYSLLALEKLKNQVIDPQALTQTIENSNPSIKNDVIVSSYEFSFIAHWSHIVIRQLIKAGWRQIVPAQFCRKLKSKVTEQEVSQALQTLQKLNLISWDESQNIYTCPITSFSTSNDVSSEAIRKHHHQMIERASEALEEEPVENREFTSATFAFDKKDLPEVKELIRSFRDRLEKLYANDKAKDIYQFNVQFFPHTQGDDL